MPTRRVDVLDSLRGLAALAVTVFHLKDNLPPGILRTIFARGNLGVAVFFVISGFVIPYAMHNANYHTRDYGRFMLKRMIRLEPPYLVSLLLALTLGYVASTWPGAKPFQPSLAQVLLHLGYLNVFFGYPWLSPVYWTLAIELQYYLMIGLTFPLIKNYWIPLFIALGSLAFLIRSDRLVFHYFFLFMLGIATYKYFAAQFSRRAYLTTILVLTLGLFFLTDAWATGTGLLTTLAIAFVRINPLRGFGLISYSLYLVHGFVVSQKSVSLISRLTDSQFLIVTIAFGLAVLAAYVLYRFVERPCQRWAKKIRYKAQPVAVIRADSTPAD